MKISNSARYRSLAVVVAIPLVTALFFLATPTASASSAVAPSDYGTIQNHDLKCLDMTGGSLSNNTPAQQYTCNGNPQQYWALYPLGTKPTPYGTEDIYLIVNYNSGLCLSISGNDPNPGGAVIQYSCNRSGSDNWEDWYLVPSSSSSDVYIFNLGSCSGACAMHPSGSGTANGLKIYVNYPTDNGYLWS